ncbi:MAG: hypothetical protein JNL93_16205 [Pelomonas sp.]|nr:hypothetical protein [Roseateles sp.]
MRALALLLISAPALAHDGHGPAGPHLHAWDSGTTLALAVAAGLAVWWFAKGRK